MQRSSCVWIASKDFGSTDSVSNTGKIFHPISGTERLWLQLEVLGMLVPSGGKECSLVCRHCMSFWSAQATPTWYQEGYNLDEHHRQ